MRQQAEERLATWVGTWSGSGFAALGLRGLGLGFRVQGLGLRV